MDPNLHRPRVSSVRHSSCHSRLTMPVKYPCEYNGDFPNYAQPTKLGVFSVDGNRQFLNDERNIKYFCEGIYRTQPELDLNAGFESAIRKNQLKYERLVFMLKYISANITTVKTWFPERHPSESFGADFVCYRGLLTTIANMPYESQDDCIICATKFRGTIYLCAFHTEERLQRELHTTLIQSKMSYWGYKFEQYMLADSPYKEPRPDVQLNENEEFCITVKGKLSQHKLLFSAEVDGIDPHQRHSTSKTENFIELKTSRIITSQKQHANFCRHKLRKYWAQSFLIGIPSLYCGFRDDDGKVQTIHKFSTKELSTMGRNFWSPSSMMNFLDTFLSFIKKCVIKDDPSCVYKFYWKPGQDIVGEELYNCEEYQILPDWYIKCIQNFDQQ